MEVVGDLGKLTKEENTEVVVEQVRVTSNSNLQGDNGNWVQDRDIHEFEMASASVLHGIYPGEHVDLILDAVLHMGSRTMHFTQPCAREMRETQPVVGPSIRSTWKKRAGIVGTTSAQTQSCSVLSKSMKRGREFLEGQVLDLEGVQRKKSKISSRVVSHYDSLSAAAVE
ncbi:hypothetical protein FCV25MIE_02504 [Fagus crenata]